MEPRSDPERQIEEARASLMAHLGELGRRFRAARARFDLPAKLPAKIAAHPLASVGAAFAVGALLGLRGRSKRQAREGDDVERGLGRAVAAAVAALGIRLVKELAMRKAAEAARGWWEQRQEASQTEVRASYEPAVEPFLER